MAVLIVTDQTTQRKSFFAGFYRDGAIVWTVVERNALDKPLSELKTIATNWNLDQYTIRERLPEQQTFRM